MKSNEAPEKIYVALNEIDEDERTFVLDHRTDYPICTEYIRTDAFIEKARKWFIKHTNISQEIETNEDGEPLADSYIKYAKARFDAANEMFENFKNYMKGE